MGKPHVPEKVQLSRMCLRSYPLLEFQPLCGLDHRRVRSNWSNVGDDEKLTGCAHGFDRFLPNSLAMTGKEKYGNSLVVEVVFE